MRLRQVFRGKGRLCSLEKIYNAVDEALNYSELLKDKKVVITAGGTIEEIDPVRYISNYSSGKMGLALAKSAYDMGAEVVFITTKDFEVPFKKVIVKSAQQMQSAVNAEFDNADYIIMAAAVADYRVKDRSNQKMKKGNQDSITLELVKNPDILAELCKNKSDQVIVGFCAESENLIQNAKVKIEKKGCDYLIANDISRQDIGFGSEDNEVTILDKSGGVTKLDKAPKNVIARKIWETVAEK